jgi:hypothetical protein
MRILVAEAADLQKSHFIAWIVLGSLLIDNRWVSGSEDPEAFFEAKIRPVLVENCLRCHGEDKAS